MAETPAQARARINQAIGDREAGNRRDSQTAGSQTATDTERGEAANRIQTRNVEITDLKVERDALSDD